MRAVVGSSSTPVTRAAGISPSTAPMNAPVPHEGSSTLPPSMPIDRSAEQTALAISGGV